MKKNVPTNKPLYARVKAAAKAKFDVYPSAYANAWAAKEYKKKGGTWDGTAKHRWGGRASLRFWAKLTDVNKINFEQVCETSSDTLRKSVDALNAPSTEFNIEPDALRTILFAG